MASHDESRNPNDIDLKAVFGRFAGQEVAFKEIVHEYKRPNGETITQTYCDPVPGDPVIADLEQTAAAHGLKLRLFWPDLTVGTADLCDDRLNAFIGKESDGKYRILPDFRID